jgi:hypothetical protein
MALRLLLVPALQRGNEILRENEGLLLVPTLERGNEAQRGTEGLA